jgi:hypothetical protein
VNISFTTVVLSAELLEETLIPVSRCDNAGQPDEVVPVVVGNADDEDEGADDADEDEEEDDEGLDYDWEEVGNEEDDEEDEEEDEDE